MAQTYPVQANLSITPPYSIYLSDYTSPGSTKLMVNLYFADLTKPAINVRFRVKIEGVGIELKSKVGFIGRAYSLLSGMPEIIYGDQLAEYFLLDNLDFSGITREELAQTGALPEGVYRFTLEVLEYNRGVQISNSATSIAWLVLNDPPVLNLPAQGMEITSIDPQIIRFQWTPRHKGSPNASFTTEYRLKIVEIWPDQRNPYDAVNSMTPVFETATPNHYYVMGLGDPLLIPGRRYAWQVQAVSSASVEQLDLFKNNGWSEVRSFRFGQVCDPPAQIDLEAAHNREIELSWPTPENATGFSVLFQGQESNDYWYEAFSYLPQSRIKRLEPETTYDVQVIAHCSQQKSEPSAVYSFTTLNSLNEFVCGNIDFQPNLDNRQPIDFLYEGEIIKAGDFDVELERIIRIGNRFSGYGLIKLPFLQQVTTYVTFDNLEINTEKEVYAGHLTTFYDQGRFYQDSESPDFSDAGNEIGGQESGTDSLLTAQGSEENYIAVDSIYTNPAGEVIIVINGEATPVSADEQNTGTEYRDEQGNTVSIGTDGSVVVNPSAPATGTSTATSSSTASNHQADFSFGPLKIIVTEDKEPEIKEGICQYDELIVAIELELQDLEYEINRQIELKSAIFSYKKDCETGEFISGQLRWNNSSSTKSLNLLGIQAEPLELEIEITAVGLEEGQLLFKAGLEEDMKLGGLALIKKGLTGEFKFLLSREYDTLTTGFDFEGIENVNLELIKQDKVLARLQNGSFDANGSLKGKFRLSEQVEYTAGSYHVLVTKFDLDIAYRLGRDIDILNGEFKLRLSDFSLLEGEIILQSQIRDGLIETTVSGKNLVAFGMELSNLNLKTDLDTELNISSLKGNLSGNHPELGLDLSVDQFELLHGQLIQFNFSGDIVQDGINIKVQEASINREDGFLELAAYVELEQNDVFIVAQVHDFRIYSDGRIEWGEYDLNFDGIKTFGPLTVSLTGATGDQSGRWRFTEAEASLSLELDNFPEPVTITGAKISFEKHRSRDHYRNISISIDEANIKSTLGFLETYLSAIDLKLETTEDYIAGDGSNAAAVKISGNSYIKFNLALAEDVSLGNLLYLTEGLSGELIYSFSGEGIRGRLAYHDVNNLGIELRKNEDVLASLSETNLTNEGLLTGRLTALAGATFSVGNYRLDVDMIDYAVKLSLQQGLSSFEVLSGIGSFALQGKGELAGNLNIDYQLDEMGNVKASVANSSSLKAFGMVMTDFDLLVDMDRDFSLQTVKGSMMAKHPEYGSAVSVSDFLLDEGTLVTFKLQGEVNYNGFLFKLHNAVYENQVLDISGEVAIDVGGTSAWLAVDELQILANGDVIVKGIAGELDKAPVYISFTANMADTRFSGEFTGELSGIGLSGALDLGVADNAYQFAYLELAAKGNVPLAGSGLKLTELGGQLGYNYKLVYSDAGEKPEGNPQEGNYVAGLLIGVADMTNLVEVKGNAVAQFGEDNFDLNLNGTITIPKESHMVKGDVNVNYLLPEQSLDGNVKVELAVPAGSGRALKANFDMAYTYANKDWALSSTDISASLFGEVDFSGNLDLTGSATSAAQGLLEGRVDYEFQYTKEFRALATDFRASLTAGLNFDGRMAFDNSGLEGQVYLLVYANGELGMVSDIGEYSTLLSISGSSEALMEFQKDSARIAGDLVVAISVLGYEHDVKVEIDKHI